jgi:hypothetical protein
VFKAVSFLWLQLSKKVINMGELRRIASQGIPDGAGIRSTVWKVINLYLFFFLKNLGLLRESERN